MDNEVLKQEFTTLREEIKQGFAEQRVETNKQFAEQRVETDKKFAEQEKKIFDKFHEEMAELVETSITPQFEELRGEIASIKREMVTKSYLDNKLADFEGGMVARSRKEDAKVNRLLKMLESKSVLSNEEVHVFDDYQIFPRLPAV